MIREGILTTHRLGFEYLWTDTLCILQDSDSDKNHEIAKIGEIYSKASLTIVAASAKKADDGFLEDREPLSSIALPFFSSDKATTGTFFVRECRTTPPDEAINNRAWCFQERILSPRCLVLGSYTVQYKCHQGISNVGDTIPVYLEYDFEDDYGDPGDEKLILPSLQSLTASKTEALSAKDMAETWSKILNNYTRCLVTNPTDRLVAISGIAQVLHQAWWP